MYFAWDLKEKNCFPDYVYLYVGYVIYCDSLCALAAPFFPSMLKKVNPQVNISIRAISLAGENKLELSTPAM